MSLETKIVALAQAIGADVKTLTVKQGDLTALTTTAKGNLVAAINELRTLIGSAGAVIDDSAGDGDVDVAWSADKVFDSIAAAIALLRNELTAGASAALDTFAELAAALNNDPNFAANLATAMAKRVRFDDVQTLNSAEKLQACTNIGIGNPESDFTASYVAAKA